MKTALILVAAGTGKRAGGKLPKQFSEINGKPLVAHTLEKFAGIKGLAEIVIAVPPKRENFAQILLFNLLKKFSSSKFVAGGKTRQQSVFNALSVLSPQITHVLVHDAARPFVNPADVNKLLRMLRKKEAVILASPASDTVKQVSGGVVKKTLDRREIYLAETPQGFSKKLLLTAHLNAQKKGFTFSDDSALVEALGRRVAVCPSDGKNQKVTSKADLEEAKRRLSKGKNSAG